MSSDEETFATPSPGGDETNTTSAQGRAPAVERRIGPYRILRELGQGGMGVVYLAARADEEFRKRVALKVIRSGAASEEVVRHFKRERQILAGLDHPNIAKLLDGGTTDDGLPYFVMEHIEGEPLLTYCDSRKLSVAERLKLFQAICSAVQYAHRNLVVHRDIKPGNIVVAEDGSPRLLDFGIAKFLNPELAGEAPTATALVMTPAYASPEQARGERITTATDVYSLGVVLYELLTGHLPYRLLTRQPLEILKAISEQEPEKASTAIARVETATTASGGLVERVTPDVSSTREGTPDKLQRRLRGDLDNILMLALRKEPPRRYASVEAFSDDIRRYLEGLPVKARRPTAGYRTGKFLRRHAAGVAASAVFVVLLIGFAAAMAMQSARVARERDQAEKERAAAQQERETAQRVSTFLMDLFRVSDPSKARGNTITAREVLDTGTAKITTELKGDPEVRATLMTTMGSVYTNLGLYDKALPLLEDALQTRKAALGNENIPVSRSLSSLGILLQRMGDYPGAAARHREALAMLRKVRGNDDHVDVARHLNNLALALSSMGDYAAAEALQLEALAMQRKRFGNEHASVALALANLASVLEKTGEYARAEPLHREALAMKRKLQGNEHPGVAASLNNLANSRYRQGDYEEAEALCREAIALRRKVLGNEHPDLALSLNNLADVLMAKGDYSGAENVSREAVDMGRRLLGDGNPELAIFLVTHAEALCRVQKPAEGESFARQSLAIFKKGLPAGHPHIAVAESVLGGCLILSRRYKEAEPLVLASYPVIGAKSGERSPETGKALERIVALYDAWGKPEKAAEYRGKRTKEKP
jgi:eukaryotic-like serine/threonine-protein kinase